MAMTPAQIDAYIQAHYGYESWALQIPELRNVLEHAVGPNGIAVDQNTLNGLVQSTSWYKTTTNAMRQWVQLQGEDPSTAKAQTDKAQGDIQSEARKLGVELPAGDLQALAVNSIGYQWDQNMMDNALYAEQYRQTFNKGGTQASTITGNGSDRLITDGQKTLTGDPFTGGTVNDYYSQVMQDADSYLVSIPPATAAAWAIQMSTGQLDPKGVQGSIIKIAAGKFPSMAQEINAGMTPKDLFSGIQGDIAKTLELSTDQVDFMAPQYSQVLQYADPTSGKIRPMTDAEAMNWARSQPQWKTTTQGNQAASQAVDQLATSFGTAKYTTGG